MDWHNFIKKYVWDENKTPYFTRVEKLTQEQARNESFIYTVVMCTVAAVAALFAAASASRHPDLLLVAAAAYSVSIGVSAVLFGFYKHIYAAVYCMTAPVAAFLYFLTAGFHPNLHTVDHVVLTVCMLLWLIYSLRVVAIAKAYPDMP